MKTTYINGENIYYAFLSGAMEVKKQKNILNKINVFPVADGDTGSNLVSTLNSIVSETKMQKSIKETLKSMSEAALLGARGNSGIIFAQFINGINEEITDEEILSINSFAEVLKKAVPYVYKAVINPIEGTMITVIREWSEAFYKVKDTVNTFEEIIILTLEDAKKSLANTPNLLLDLKKASVVDSGASGFVHFLEGIVSFAKNEITKDTLKIEDEELLILDTEEHNFKGSVKHRYCTEALISIDNINVDDINASIAHLGDSLIVAGSKSKARIHIHTNDPGELFSILRTKGTILQQKADDMKKQHMITQNRLYDTVIVTDSIADIPESLIEKYQIYVIPLNLIIEGSTYLDKVTITPSKFYSILDKVTEYPTSSQPSLKNIENVFSFLTTHYTSVICINVSKELSGTYNIVKTAAEKFIKQGKKITIIDSKLNSGAEGLLVLKAAEEIASGKSYEEVVHITEESIKKIKIFVSVNTVKYMVKGGRISHLKGLLAKFVNIKPIVSLDENGKGIAFGKAFSSKRNKNKIINIVNNINKENKILKYNIVHANCEEKAKQFSQDLTKLLGQAPKYITEISPIIGLNSGTGAMAVSFITD